MAWRKLVPGTQRRNRPAPEAAPADLAASEEASGGPVRPAVVFGLGNPGEDYGATRHNLGAWTVNLLAQRHGGRLKREGRVDAAEIDIGGRRLVIARPRSYMNESGPPIAQELRRLGVKPQQMLVVYDDLDTPVAKVRIRLQGSHGGNNGMRSIIGTVGTNEFPRIRIGIDRPYEPDGRPVRDPERVAKWVLSRPSPADREALEAAVERAADAIELAVAEGVEKAMNRYNA